MMGALRDCRAVKFNSCMY